MDAALARARETVRTTRALAERLRGTRWHDTLMLEALSLEAVIDRLERRSDTTPADAAELEAEVAKVLRLAMGRADTPPGRLH